MEKYVIFNTKTYEISSIVSGKPEITSLKTNESFEKFHVASVIPEFQKAINDFLDGYITKKVKIGKL